MPLPCQDFRDRLIASSDQATSLDIELRNHLLVCAACDGFAKRIALHARSLRELVRHTAPPELSGRVVAATQAGMRQQRAVAHVSRLSRLAVPAQLETGVFDAQARFEALPGHAKAPEVLDRLVAEELQDPPKAIVRRAAGRLERLKAPGTLRARVEHEALSPHDRRSMWRRFPGATIAAGTLLLIASFVFLVRRQQSASAPHYDFIVEHRSASHITDVHVRSMLAGVTGGWSEARTRNGGGL